MIIIIIMRSIDKTTFTKTKPIMVKHRRGEFYNGMTCMNFWYWLINHDVFSNEIGKKPITFLLDLYKQAENFSNKCKKGYIDSCQKIILASESISKLEPVYRCRNPLMKGWQGFP